jgi:tetratricopeptide (TPR) repeat protein
MKQPHGWRLGVFLALALSLPGWLWAQEPDDLTRKLIRSYDLLEAGNLSEAKQLYQEILKEHPDNPLALNNFGALMVREGDYPGALQHLEKALPHARGYRVRVNKVCDVEGVCLAFRPLALEYGDQDLEPLVRLNLELLKTRMAAEGQGK